MASKKGVPSPTLSLRRYLVPSPPRPYVLPLRSIVQPASLITPQSVRARFQSSSGKNPPFQEWTGTSQRDHAVNRAKEGDTTDPEVQGAAFSREERKESEGIADSTKSQATTQRDHRQNNPRAKKDHPKAPEPVIGMNDERGEVRLQPQRYMLFESIEYFSSFVRESI